ncbi:MAG: LysM peptidoglycan-binding domain-containing protein [Bacillota bacterium]|jgi:spore coat assembly protein SafA
MLIYTVKKGETLWLIAKHHHLSLEALVSANPQIMDPNKIIPGMQIYIPQKPMAESKEESTQPFYFQQNAHHQTSQQEKPHYQEWSTVPHNRDNVEREPAGQMNIITCPYCHRNIPHHWPQNEQNSKQWTMKK